MDTVVFFKVNVTRLIFYEITVFILLEQSVPSRNSRHLQNHKFLC